MCGYTICESLAEPVAGPPPAYSTSLLSGCIANARLLRHWRDEGWRGMVSPARAGSRATVIGFEPNPRVTSMPEKDSRTNQQARRPSARCLRGRDKRLASRCGTDCTPERTQRFVRRWSSNPNWSSPLYEGQALLCDIQALRSFASANPYASISQLLWADALLCVPASRTGRH